MSKGFLQRARQEIYANPGQSAQQIARKLLASGEVESMAQNPEMSLVATLSKHYRDIDVTRRKIDGSFRYFPSDSYHPLSDVSVPRQASVDVSADQITITSSVEGDYTEFADALVLTGRCKSRNEAFLLMLGEGKEAIKRSMGRA